MRSWPSLSWPASSCAQLHVHGVTFMSFCEPVYDSIFGLTIVLQLLQPSTAVLH